MNATPTEKDQFEYPKGSGIHICQIRNKTRGSASREGFGHSYRVRIPARLAGGARKDRQFRDINEARNFARDEYANLAALGEEFSMLDKNQRRIAVRATRYAKQHGLDLMDAVEFASSRLNPEGGERTVDQVVDEFITIKEARAAKGDLRERSLRDARSRCSKLSKAFGDYLIKTLTPQDIRDYLVNLHVAYRTRRNYRMVWGEVFKFATERRYILDNPIKALSTEDERQISGNNTNWTPPEILSISETSRLLKEAFTHPELNLEAAVVLGLFAGVRTEELKRLRWADVHLDDPDEPRVTIPAGVAKKRNLRHIPLESNAIEWLLRCRRATGQITRSDFENDYQRRFQKLLDLADFGDFIKRRWHSRWKKNGMRHSYGTYHFARHGNSLQTASNMGHKSGDQILFDHYRNLATRSEGQAFFNLVPETVLEESEKVIPLAVGC